MATAVHLDEVMNHDPATVTPDSSLAAAAATMRSRGVGSAVEIASDRLALARVVEAEALAALRAAKPGRALFTNVEYWSAAALEAAGIARQLFTPTFAAARSIGWTAHILEQVRDNRLIRPDVDYVGPTERAVPRGPMMANCGIGDVR